MKLNIVDNKKNANATGGKLITLLKLYLSAVMQGTARATTKHVLNYTLEKRQTGREIIHHQNVRKKIIEMKQYRVSVSMDT